MKRLILTTLVLCNLQITNVYAQTCYPSNYQTTPTTRFILKTDGTALDNKTGLIWKRCLEGNTWNGNTCTGTANLANWQNALKMATSSKYAGKTDWRLPNIKELGGIHERACLNPEINLTVFPNMPTLFLWSSTSYASDATYAWTGGSGYQNHWYTLKSKTYGVLLVRDAP